MTERIILTISTDFISKQMQYNQGTKSVVENAVKTIKEYILNFMLIAEIDVLF